MLKKRKSNRPPIFQVHKSDDFFAPKQSFSHDFLKSSQNTINPTPICFTRLAPNASYIGLKGHFNFLGFL